MILLVLPDVSTDEGLLRRLKQGDPNAVLAAYELYFPPLYQYARLKVGDSTVAEDIVSDVFVTLIESLGRRSAPKVNLRGWLFSVARNKITRTYGQAQSLPLEDVEDWMPAPTEYNPENQVVDWQNIERVRQALRMLNADQQEALILRFGQRLPLQDTADIMGKSLSAVKSLQFRALETLRTILVEPDSEATA